MSRQRVVTTDEQGRRQTAWAGPDEQRSYGFMEPAFQAPIERRVLTPDELAERTRPPEPSPLARFVTRAQAHVAPTPVVVSATLVDPEPEEEPAMAESSLAQRLVDLARHAETHDLEERLDMAGWQFERRIVHEIRDRAAAAIADLAIDDPPYNLDNDRTPGR